MSDTKTISADPEERTEDVLQSVLSQYGISLRNLRFMSLQGDRLRAYRPPIVRQVRGASGTYEERRPRGPWKFEDGFYPAPGVKLSEEEAREMLASPFCKNNPEAEKHLFQVAPPPPKPPKPVDQQIEERAQERAEELLQSRLLSIADQLGKLGISLDDLDKEGVEALLRAKDEEQPGGDGPGPDEEDVEVQPRGAYAVLTGVQDKLGAIEALKAAGADVSFASNISKTTVSQILEEARKQGFVIEGWGE